MEFTLTVALSQFEVTQILKTGNHTAKVVFCSPSGSELFLNVPLEFAHNWPTVKRFTLELIAEEE